MGLAELHQPIAWNDRPTAVEQWRAECVRRAKRLHLLEQSAEMLALDREYCARGFDGLCHWLQSYCWMIDPDPTKAPHERTVPVVLWDSQVEFLHWLYGRIEGGHPAALVPKTRKLGVTWLVLLTCLWYATFQRSFSALLGSRKQELVDASGSDVTLFGKIRGTISRLPVHVRPVVEIDRSLFLRFDNESQLIGESTNNDFGRSGRVSVVFLDEFAAVEAPKALRTWMSIESVGKTAVAVWNPGPEDHITWQLHMGKDGDRAPEDAVRFLDWRFNPSRDQDWWDSRIIENGGRLTREMRDSIYGGKYGFVVQGRIFNARPERVAFDADAQAIAQLRSTCYHVAGWDYGSGESYTSSPGGCLQFDVDGHPWVLWIVDDLEWSRVSHPLIAAEACAVLDQHPIGVVHWGDPAGDSAESDQSSWAHNLRTGGVPITTLAAACNRVPQFVQAIQRIQMWMDRGQLRVHTRCERLWRVLREWSWNTDPDHPTKAIVKPNHDKYSHMGMALLYLSMGLEPWLSERATEELARRGAGDSAGSFEATRSAFDSSGYTL